MSHLRGKLDREEQRVIAAALHWLACRGPANSAYLNQLADFINPSQEIPMSAEGKKIVWLLNRLTSADTEVKRLQGVEDQLAAANATIQQLQATAAQPAPKDAEDTAADQQLDALIASDDPASAAAFGITANPAPANAAPPATPAASAQPTANAAPQPGVTTFAVPQPGA